MNSTYTYKFLKAKKGEKGAVAIIVAICLVMFIGFAALAIDIGHLYVVKNELQNAADAGALAGARVLYTNNGQSVNPDANEHAFEVAIEHLSENVAVDVNWVAGMNSEADCDVQRGHWSFTTQTFTADDSLSPVDLWDISSLELDNYDPDHPFINAVRVRATRTDTPAASFFARIFGHESFQMAAEAVAYIGFAGSVMPHDVDQPIAICKQAITDENGDYTCNMGRMLNSGSSDPTYNTGGWTNFTQPCDTADTQDMMTLICGSGNPDPINYGEEIGATGGVQAVSLRDFKDCWVSSAPDASPEGGDGIPDGPWEMTLPVVDCPGNNVSNCAAVVGAVHLSVIWVLDNQAPNGLTQVAELPLADQYQYVPRYMDVPGHEPWSSTTEDPSTRWGEFVNAFNLLNFDDYGNLAPAPYQNMAIYFMPVCDYFEPIGTSQGQNFGVLAEIPVLVH